MPAGLVAETKLVASCELGAGGPALPAACEWSQAAATALLFPGVKFKQGTALWASVSSYVTCGYQDALNQMKAAATLGGPT